MSADLSTPYFEVHHDRARDLVRLVRTAHPYPSIPEMVAASEALGRKLEPLKAARCLIDMRNGPPGRNDEAFEHAGEQSRRELHRHFKKVGVLVRTVAGVLQVQRLNRQSGITAHVFKDEVEALRYLES